MLPLGLKIGLTPQYSWEGCPCLWDMTSWQYRDRALPTPFFCFPFRRIIILSTITAKIDAEAIKTLYSPL